MKYLRLSLMALGFFTGCTELPAYDDPKDQTPPSDLEETTYATQLEEAGCEMTILPIDSDDPALGFSADDILDYAEGVFSTDMVWLDDETSVPVDLSITYTGGPIELLDNEPTSGGSGTDVAQCTDSLAIEVEVLFSTLDDSFNEAFTAHLTTSRLSEVTFFNLLDHENLGGTFTFDQVAPDSYDQFTMKLFGAIAEDGSTRGSISASGEMEQNGAHFVDSFPVSGWPAADFL